MHGTTPPGQQSDARPVLLAGGAEEDGAAPPMLPYADLPARWGVSVERSDKLVRVVVPPVPGWRHLHKGFFIGFGVYTAMMLLNVVRAAEGLRVGLYGPLLSILGTWGLGLAIGIGLALQRLRQRTVLEVTDRKVSVRFVPSRTPTRYMSWRRDAIGEIKLNPFDGMLLIRVTGVDLVEVYPSPRAEVNEFVAAVLADALRSVPAAPPRAAW